MRWRRWRRSSARAAVPGNEDGRGVDREATPWDSSIPSAASVWACRWASSAIGDSLPDAATAGSVRETTVEWR